MNDAGKISFLPKGEYDSGAMYEALDVVKYDGMVWAAKKSSKGITPAEGENWMCLLTAADYATEDAPGIVRPDGDTIEVSTDATISVSSKTLTFADHDTATSSTSFTDAEDGNMLVTDWTKNLLNPTLETTTKNGVTCTNNGDGTYTLNGTATDNFSFELCIISKDEFTNKRCLLIDCGKAANSSDKRFGLIAKETTTRNWKSANDSNDYKVILDEYYCTKKVSVKIEGVKGDSYNNAIVKPMLTTDLSATYDDFVPYGGYEIKSCGKNLLNPTLGTTTMNGVACTANGDGTYTLNGTATGEQYFKVCEVDLVAGKKYKLVGCPAGGDYNGFSIYTATQSGVKFDIGYSCLFTAEESKSHAVIIRNADTEKVFSNLLFKPMFVDADLYPSATYDDFEPYTGETITVTNDTESPAFGLKSHKGITNIISPANVKCVYPTNESGKGVLDAMYNNSQLSNELSKLKNAIIAMGGTV